MLRCCGYIVRFGNYWFELLVRRKVRWGRRMKKKRILVENVDDVNKRC